MSPSGPHPAPTWKVVRWQADLPPPSEQEAEAKLHQEGYESFRWHDVPGSSYPRHRHGYDECLWILKGRIEFSIEGEQVLLEPGDRLYLPSRIPHTAQVPKSSSVTYMVGQKR